MELFIVPIAYIALIGRALCSEGERKTVDVLMASLHRVQRGLHSIRSIVSKYSETYCQARLNMKPNVRLSDLENCANYKFNVKEGWAAAMNPTLFELRHFRRALLQVTGDRKVLTPYFLLKLANFLQDEDNIMSDAVTIATEICVTNQEESPEKQTIKQELDKYRKPVASTTTEKTTEKHKKKAATTSTKEAIATSNKEATAKASREETTEESAVRDSPISDAFGGENWILVPTDEPATDVGYNDGWVTVTNETTPIKTTDVLIEENNVKLQFGSETRVRVTINGTQRPVKQNYIGDSWNRKSLQDKRRGNATLNYSQSWTTPSVLIMSETEAPNFYREMYSGYKWNWSYYYNDEDFYYDVSTGTYSFEAGSSSTSSNKSLNQVSMNDEYEILDYSGSGSLDSNERNETNSDLHPQSGDKPIVANRTLFNLTETTDGLRTTEHYSEVDEFEYELENCTDPNGCSPVTSASLIFEQSLP